MRLNFKKNASYIAFAIIIVGSLIYSRNNRWYADGGSSWKQTINSDGISYYAYLPAIFIYQDLDYSFAEKIVEKGYLPAYSLYYYRDFNGEIVNMTFVGVAILILPFFLLAYFLSFLFGYDIDGYSDLFQFSVSIAALFYLILGLIYLRKILKLYGFNEINIALVLVLFVFATNILYYLTIEPSMSHIYSFSAIAVFIFYIKRLLNDFNVRNLIIVSSLFALIILVRPVNGIIIFLVPFLAGSLSELTRLIKNYFSHARYPVLSILIFTAIIFLQPLMWYLQTGKFYVYAYEGGSFDFTNPHMLSILISYKKGLFVYAPITFLSLFGFIPLFRKNKFEAVTLILFLLLTTFVLSSWWSWYYGVAYGLRAFIEFMPVFIILLVYLFSAVKQNLLKSILVLICVSFVSLNILQMYQYKRYILHRGNMDKEKYWEIFLQTSRKYWGIHYLEKLDKERVANKTDYSFSGSEDKPYWTGEFMVDSLYSDGDRKVIRLNKEHPFSPRFKIPRDSISQVSDLFVTMSFDAYMDDLDADTKIAIISRVDGEIIQWVTIFLADHFEEKQQWESFSFDRRLDNKGDMPTEIEIYIMNYQHELLLDKLHLSFSELSP